MPSTQSRISQVNNNLLILHLTVFIWGFTGILGALISISAVQLVWYRVLIAALSLFLYFKFSRKTIAVSRKSFVQLIFIGAMVGAHWILFFASIKLANVPVALVCLSSITLFTAFLDPFISKKKISRLEIIAGILIVIGIIIIFKFEVKYTKGIGAGLFSALFASLFSICNAIQVKKYQAPVIAFYELVGALFWTSLYLLLAGGFDKHMLLHRADLGYLLLLGTVCTSLAYVAGISVMRELSAFRVALITNLEPVYGIIMSFLFFGESDKMTAGFWVGALIILSTIFLFPVVQRQIIAHKSR